jgi:hypothetical protein
MYAEARRVARPLRHGKGVEGLPESYVSQQTLHVARGVGCQGL